MCLVFGHELYECDYVLQHHLTFQIKKCVCVCVCVCVHIVNAKTFTKCRTILKEKKN